MYKPALVAATWLGATAVIIGAFGAHYLKTIFTADQLISFETGVKYQFYHALALLFSGIIGLYFQSKYLKFATICFIGGTIMFSGSIYLLNILKSKEIIGLSGLGIITPLGGLLLIAGWFLLLFNINGKQN
jgi:uncharacterized membrane protein YgdD (TMEM256/DUF423 family)